MRRYLAIDTATDHGSVAFGEPGGVVEEVLLSERRHATGLAAAIERLLDRQGVGLPELTGVVAADGPGSFTGLRIGFATALGLIRAHQHLEFLTVTSLLGAAWRAHRRGNDVVAALYDALRGEVFAAVYRFGNGSVDTLLSPTLLTVARLIEIAPESPDVVVGDGALVHTPELVRWTGREPLGPPLGGPSAAALIDLLVVSDCVKTVGDALAFEPTYGRKAEAQVRWERKHGRPLPDPAGD